MKKTKILYWTFTGLFAIMMLLSSIPDILVTSEAVAFITNLGYPRYFIPFIGFAKLLGVLAILIPGLMRIKEWAYAGFAFDLIGAVYSQLAIGGSITQVSFMLIPITFGVLSYIFYHKKNQVSS